MITLTKFLEEAKRTIPQDKDVATKKKAAPKKYHVKLSKGTKKARAKHFEEHGQKADNDPSAYVPAPGDEKAKTKESKYTKAYKKRFGEDVDLQYVDDEFFMEEVDHLFPCEYEVLDEEMIEEALWEIKEEFDLKTEEVEKTVADKRQNIEYMRKTLKRTV